MAELTYESAFPVRFLKAALFNGKPATLTLSRVYMEELEGDKGKENKLIASFKERTLELVLCKTNALCLKEMFGSKVAGWVGKRVMFFPTTTNFGPKKVDAIRVHGSPDIPGDIEVVARLGRKPFKATLKRVQSGAAPAAVAQKAPEPTPYDDLFDILDWTADERASYLTTHKDESESDLRARLNAEIDQQNA